MRKQIIEKVENLMGKKKGKMMHNRDQMVRYKKRSSSELKLRHRFPSDVNGERLF